MNIIFADAGFWIARRDESDQNHELAVKLTERILRRRATFLITPLVFAEVHAHFSRARITRERIIRDCWANPVVQIEQPTFADQSQAIELLRRHQDKTFSFCDVVSFVVMLRLQVRAALSFDQHFRQFGQFTIIDETDL